MSVAEEGAVQPVAQNVWWCGCVGVRMRVRLGPGKRVSVSSSHADLCALASRLGHLI
jgi:hypothetical protein